MIYKICRWSKTIFALGVWCRANCKIRQILFRPLVINFGASAINLKLRKHYSKQKEYHKTHNFNAKFILQNQEVKGETFFLYSTTIPLLLSWLVFINLQDQYICVHIIFFLEMAFLICVFGVEWWKIRSSVIVFSIIRLICRGLAEDVHFCISFSAHLSCKINGFHLPSVLL